MQIRKNRPLAEKLLVKERGKYFPLSGDGHLCIGNKNECDYFENNVTIIPWGKAPEEICYQNIKQLSLLPTGSQIRKSVDLVISDFLKSLPRLEFLTIPYPLLSNLSANTLPNSLRGLMILSEEKFHNVAKKTLWPDDLCLPQLQSLIFFSQCESDIIWPQFKITERHLPKLEYLKSVVDKNGLVVDELSKFKCLQHLEIGSVRNFDIASKIRSNSLRVITINSATQKFPFEKLIDLKKLEIINVLYIKTEIDCEIFKEFPNLIELNITSSKKLKNIDALLECKQLKSLELTDCGNPLKNGKKSYFGHGSFERIDVDYS